MLIGDQHIQSIWYDLETDAVKINDQTCLPHEFEIITLKTLHDVCHAITTMQVRGAPLIGVTAAYGLYLALRKDPAWTVARLFFTYTFTCSAANPCLGHRVKVSPTIFAENPG